MDVRGPDILYVECDENFSVEVMPVTLGTYEVEDAIQTMEFFWDFDDDGKNISVYGNSSVVYNFGSTGIYSIEVTVSNLRNNFTTIINVSSMGKYPCLQSVHRACVDLMLSLVCCCLHGHLRRCMM